MRGTLKVKQRQHNTSFLCHRPPVSLVKNNRSGESHILSRRYPKHLSTHRPLAHMTFHLSTGFSLTNMGSGRKTQHAIVSTQPQCVHSKLSKVLGYVCVCYIPDMRTNRWPFQMNQLTTFTKQFLHWLNDLEWLTNHCSSKLTMTTCSISISSSLKTIISLPCRTNVV